jgi:integrase/recombinase XerD
LSTGNDFRSLHVTFWMVPNHTTGTAARLADAGVAAVFATIKGGFTAHLRERGYAGITVWAHQWHLKRVATLLWKRGRSLNDIQRQEVPPLLHKLLPNNTNKTLESYRAPLNLWLRFSGRYPKFDSSASWQPWVDDFIRFCRVHRGLSPGYLELLERGIRTYLKWQFGTGPAVWKRVGVRDVWAFAHDQAKHVSLHAANKRLSYLRRFLSFVQLQGACAQALPAAVPHLAAWGQAVRPQILSAQQRRQFLASFSRRTPAGRRDYAMALCMIDLGMRAQEVAHLRCGDVDFRRRTLTVVSAKRGRDRMLPLPRALFVALSHYVKEDRPSSAADQLFLRHTKRHGQPMSRSQISERTRHAYRVCSFPPSWSGTHRLRHTFASRLSRAGVDVKQIADLLGHRGIESTNVYVQTDREALRRLAQRWPA